MDPASISIIQSVVPPDSNVLFFLDFLKEFAPSLILETKEDELPTDMLELIVVPTDACPVLLHVRAPQCREPAHSLVDDAVWLLVRRRGHKKRHQQRRGKVDGKDLVEDFGLNALSQGFVPAREGEQPPAGMRPGVARSHNNTINENMGFCKTSPLMQKLHAVVGDDVFRLMLTQTRLFLPVSEQPDASGTLSNRGNYILLCGPPLPKPSFRTYANVEKASPSIGKRKSCKTDMTKRSQKKRRKVSSIAPQSSHQEHLNPNESISRFSLLYVDGYTPHVGLPSSHPFQKDPPCSASEVLSTMFNLQKENKNKQRRLRKRLGSSSLEMCQKILEGHARCDYHRRLERYCPLPDIAKEGYDELREKDTKRLAQLSQAYTPQKHIVSFLSSILRRVFPNAFWGSEQNFESLMASIHAFVHLRRKERLANKNLMHGIKVLQMKWLFTCSEAPGKSKKKQRSDHKTAVSLTLTLLRWVFQGFIIPLLRTNFYVTDTEFSANQVQYYRKPVWSLFRSLSVGKVLGGGHFQHVSFTEALAMLKEHQMGISKLRLLPKATGVRPIAQLSRRQTLSFLVWPASKTKTSGPSRKGPDKNCGSAQRPSKRRKVENIIAQPSTALPRFPDTNTVLGDVLDILRYECSTKERPFGAGIDSLDFLYPKYRDYITRIKKTRAHHDLGLIFASVDIEKCYDRMRQEPLLELVDNLLSHDNYVVQQLKLHDGSNRYERSLRFKKVVEPLEAYQAIHSSGRKQLMHENRKCIFDLYKCTLVDRNRILELLKEHIRSNLVVTSGRFQKKVLHQSTGISQGSALSTILCNFYYGKVEELMFSDLPVEESDFMSRFVDDFLFISSNPESVRGFLTSTYKGVPELGAQVNLDKSVVSIETEIQAKDGRTRLSNGCRKGYNGRYLFPWCGLLFDLNSGDVSMDYQRFHGGRPGNSLTVDCDGLEGKRLEYRMQGFVFPRCLPILFDPVINSFENIVTNFFQMMLFAAVKTLEYLKSLSALTSNGNQNLGHIHHCIEDLPAYAVQTIRGRPKPFDTRQRPVKNAVSIPLATWLTWKAFHVVFVTHSPGFAALAEAIWGELESLDSQEHKISVIVSRGLDSFRLHKLVRK